VGDYDLRNQGEGCNGKEKKNKRKCASLDGCERKDPPDHAELQRCYCDTKLCNKNNTECDKICEKKFATTAMTTTTTTKSKSTTPRKNGEEEDKEGTEKIHSTSTDTRSTTTTTAPSNGKNDSAGRVLKPHLFQALAAMILSFVIGKNTAV